MSILQRSHIRRRLEEKEFIARCNAVEMCWKCGENWKNIEPPSSHHATMTCTNKKCIQYKVIRRRRNYQ